MIRNAPGCAREVRNPGVWRSAAAWRDELAARPRLADEAFSWARCDDGQVAA